MQSKHKIGYSTSRKMDFPWVQHIPIFDDSETTTIILLCSICKQHGATQRNSLVIWTDKPYISLRRDLLQHHIYRESAMHKEAQELEATSLVSERDGGEDQLCAQSKTVHWTFKFKLIFQLNSQHYLKYQCDVSRHEGECSLTICSMYCKQMPNISLTLS